MAHICQLTNGIRVVLEPMDGYRSVAAGVFVDVGSADETKTTNGLAHVIEHMLFKGTKNRSARQIADEMTEIGGNLDAYTSKEYTCFYTQTLKEHLDTAMDIISDMFLHASLNEEDVKKELGVILEEIDMYEDDADELVHELLQKEIWKNMPIGYIISGEKEIVRRFTAEDIRHFMDSYYTAGNIVISVAGHFDEAKTLAMLEEKFKDIRPGQPKPACPKPSYSHAVTVKHKMIEQMHLNLAYDSIPYVHDDKYLFTIMNNIIGGNLNSRLFQTVREEMGLAYSIYSYGSSFKQCGLFQIDAAMNPEQSCAVLQAIKTVIGRLFSEPVSEHELRLAKEQIKTELIIDAESTHNHMESNGKSVIYGEPLVSLDEVLKDIENVTAEDINAFIEKYLKNIQPSMCLVGDMSQLQLEKIKGILKSFEQNEASVRFEAQAASLKGMEEK